MSEMKNCPHCGAEDALETNLRIDLDNVVLRALDDARGRDWAKWELSDFVVAGSANDSSNGIVVEEAGISCRECGHEIEGVHIPISISDHWSFTA